MMGVIMIKFSSSKVGIVHKYHNHGFNSPMFSRGKVNIREYSTGPKRNTPSVRFNTSKESPVESETITFIETPQITSSRLVLTPMLDHLASINSPVFFFLTSDPRVKYLTSTVPYPILRALSEGGRITAFFSSAVFSNMNPAVLPFSSVYIIGHPGSGEFYVGFRIAGSNRRTGHRRNLRRNLRSNKFSLSLLQRFIVKLSGYNNAMWGSLVIESSLTTEFRLLNPLYGFDRNELFILR